MRKQTKVVAVASAAALLAIGGAMTSFAAQGWVEEDGTWYYYDKDGNRVENEWKKSGDNWFYLDGEEGGAMATDKIIVDDKDNTYYVDGNGVMVSNTWVKVVNDDQDEDEDPAEYRYYYMQSNGKAYKAGDGDVKFKTIDGKRYAFDDDGKMLYGWVKKDDANLAMDDSDWEEATYYLGSWEDGSLKTGWQKITVYDDSSDIEDDRDYWFNFKSNGEKRCRTSSTDTKYLEKKINGKHYSFDARGVMVYEWVLASGSSSTAAASATNWQYFNNPEDGARLTKGWFKVIAPEDDGDDRSFIDYSGTFAKGDSDDENERWYYADSDGDLYVGKIKKIKGKYYGFAPEENKSRVGSKAAGSNTGKAGSMLTGLCALTVNNEGEIETLWARDMDADDLDDCMKGKGDFEGFQAAGGSLYYFGNDEDADGAMKTGNVTISLDGDSYAFSFSKSGGAESKGKGLTGIDDGKAIYKYGKKIKADSDDKYKLVYATADTGSGNAVVYEIDSAALRNNSTKGVNANGSAVLNKDNDTVRFYGTLADSYYLVNTSGTIVKNKTAAKDGNDWYYYVDNKQVVMYTNSKTLNAEKSDEKICDGNGVELKNWDKKDSVTGLLPTMSGDHDDLTGAPSDNYIDN